MIHAYEMVKLLGQKHFNELSIERKHPIFMPTKNAA